jgi:uncharacterized protein YceK
MMKNFIGILLLLTILAASGCSSISVSTDYDHSVDFSKYKTYCWCYRSVIPGDRLAQLPRVKERVINAVDLVLKGKGFSIAEGSDADFYISVHGGTKDRRRIRGGPMLYDPYWGPVGGQISVDDYTEGTLYIDIIDARSRHMVWRGIGKDIVHGYAESGDQLQITINRFVARILENFPPKRSK